MRSLRCGGDSPLKTRAEGSDRLLLSCQHSAFDQHCQTRVWIDTAQDLAREPTGLNNFLIGTQPGVGYGTQSDIGGFHPAKLDLFKQLGKWIGLRDRSNRAL